MELFFITLIALVLFVVGLSITLIRKGRDLQGDVGENDQMKARGLECTTRAALREEAELRGECLDQIPELGCSSDHACGSCQGARNTKPEK